MLEQNSSPNNLLQIDLNNKNNLLPIEFIDVSFGAKVVLRKLTIVEKILECQFRKESQTFLVYLIKKLFERCPWKYQLTRLVSSRSPIEISRMKPAALKKRFSSLVLFLHGECWISIVASEKAEKQC